MIRSSIPAVCAHCGIDDFRVLLVHHIDVAMPQLSFSETRS
jgi:hypothetical protein